MTEPTATTEPVALTVTDADGVTFHAWSTEHYARLTAWQAERPGVAGDVTYRRQFRITFPRYSRGEVIRAAAAAALRPHERLVNLPMEHWGDGDVDVTAELIFPSSSWCMECGHDVRPDRYGRTHPYAVSITPAGTHRSYTVRNYHHQEAHELAARERAAGNAASVGIDGCG